MANSIRCVVCACERVFVGRMLMVVRRLDVLKDNLRTGELRLEVNPETCGIRSAKTWLEINRRVQPSRTHGLAAQPRPTPSDRRAGLGRGMLRWSSQVPESAPSLVGIIRAAGWSSLQLKGCPHPPHAVKKSPEPLSPCRHTYRVNCSSGLGFGPRI